MCSRGVSKHQGGRIGPIPTDWTAATRLVLARDCQGEVLGRRSARQEQMSGPAQIGGQTQCRRCGRPIPHLDEGNLVLRSAGAGSRSLSSPVHDIFHSVDAAALIDRLRRLLHHKGRTRDEADELIQEAFLRLHEYRQSRHVVQPEAFLVRTVQNLSVDAYRVKARRGTQTAAADVLERLIDPAPLPDEVLASRERLQRLRAGLENLSPRTRDVVLLYKIDGLSQPQIAAQLRISVSAVEKHMAKGALFLSDWMAED